LVNQYLKLKLLEENGRVSIYSPVFEGETLSEYEKFLTTHKELYRDDIGVIMARIDNIKEDGESDGYLRCEGRRSDRVGALPPSFDSCKLRLYCICVRTNILILGGGGRKTTRTYNEDPQLSHHVNILQKIDREIMMREADRRIFIGDDNLMHGKLGFYI